MRTSFHHQPEAQHLILQLSTSWQADYPILWHETAGLIVPTNVCSWWKSGRAADITAQTDFDPNGLREPCQSRP